MAPATGTCIVRLAYKVYGPGFTWHLLLLALAQQGHSDLAQHCIPSQQSSGSEWFTWEVVQYPMQTIYGDISQPE